MDNKQGGGVQKLGFMVKTILPFFCKRHASGMLLGKIYQLFQEYLESKSQLNYVVN